MTGIATEAGLLTIRGCVVQAAGSASHEFLLPLSTDAELEKRLRRRSTLDCEMGRFKYSGLDFRSWKKTGKRLSLEMSSKDKRPAQFLECKVIPEQPLLRIRRTSLVHGAVMLYNGETSVLSELSCHCLSQKYHHRINMRLTLENVSTLPVDFLTLSFDDSTVGPAQQALAEGNSSVFETYETEYDLLHRPTLAWKNQKEAKAVAPGQSVTAVVACYGKAGW
jgi:trafficking protein particle complex subunit 9